MQEKTSKPVQTKRLQRSPFVQETKAFNSMQRTYRVQEDVNSKCCIECIKVVPVYSIDDIEKGDHMVDIGSIYDHHMIIIEKKDGRLFEIVEGKSTPKMIEEKDNLVKSMRQFDFQNKNIGVVVYKNRKFTKQETGVKYYNETSGKFEYDLIENNCEHFVTFCVTG